MKKILIKIFFIIFLTFSFASTFAASGNSNESPKDTCTGNSSCLADPNYKFPTDSLVPGGVFKGKVNEKNVNKSLSSLIQKIMIPFGVLAVFVMTVGAGYMILANGQDELLNKGKRIFKMGIIATVIALASYLLISLLKYLLYT